MSRFRTAASDDRGDTLVEVLIALAIVAIAGTALIGTLLTSITASSEHRSLTGDEAALKSYAATAQQAIQRQASPLFTGCATTYAVPPPTLATGYTVTISTIQHWDGTAFTTACPDPASDDVQLITITATSPTQVSSVLSFAVRKPS